MKIPPYKLEMNQQSLNFQIKSGDLILLSFSILEARNNEASTISLSRDVVEKAIDYMQRRHALLRSRLQHDKSNGTSHLLFDQESQLEPNKIPIDWDKCKSRDEMVKCFETKLSSPFGFDTLPYLWRVFVTEFVEDGKRLYAVAIWLPMLITDGINGVTLNIELVNIINALLVNQECIEMKEKLEHFGDVYNLAAERNLLGDKARENMIKLKEKKNGAAADTSPCMLPSEFKSHSETGTRLSLIRLDRENTANLLKIAKQRGHRFTGVVAAVFFYSLKQLFDENNIDHKFDEVKFCLPVSLRFRYNPPLSMRHTGYNILLPSIGLKNYVYDQNNLTETIWTNTERINKEVDQILDFDKAEPYLPLFDGEGMGVYNNLLHNAFDKNDASSADMLYTSRSGDFAVSNIGKYVAESVSEFEQGPFKIAEHYFGDSLSSNPTLLASLIAYSQYWNDQIFIMISSNSCTMAEKYARRFAQLMERNLVYLSKI